LVKKFDVHANQITEWKKQLLSGTPDVFKKGAPKPEDTEQTVSELHAKIGQLTMENDFFEPGLTRVHEPQGKEMVTRMEPFRSFANPICWICLAQRSTTYPNRSLRWISS